MSIELGNRLAQIRKQAGLTQEEVASKLGVSRQAVSRWEKGEASPDTENLIALADLYNVTLDDLVRGGKAEEAQPEGKLADEGEEYRKQIEVEIDEDDDDEDRHDSRFSKMFFAFLSLAALVGYLLCGFLWKTPEGGAVGWASMWILFLAPGLLHSLYRAFRDGKMVKFNIPLLVVMVYVGMGIIGSFYGRQFWHPYWIEFFSIPVYYTIAGFIDSGRKE